MRLSYKIPSTNKPITSVEIRAALANMVKDEDFMQTREFVTADEIFLAPVVIESLTDVPSLQLKQLADLGYHTNGTVPDVSISLGKGSVKFKDIIEYYVSHFEAMQVGICFEFHDSERNHFARSNVIKTTGGMFLRIRIGDVFKLFYIGWLGNEPDIEKMIKHFTTEDQWQLIAYDFIDDLYVDAPETPKPLAVSNEYNAMIKHLNDMYILTQQAGGKEGLNQEALKELIVKSHLLIEDATSILRAGGTEFDPSSV